MKELLEIIRARQAHPEAAFALATVVRVEGSSYRKPGARMLIGTLGRVAGSVSGGCLERDVISKGLARILDGAAELVSYDTNDQDDMAFGTSLGCEGRIEILIQPLPVGTAWALAETVEQVAQTRKPTTLATCCAAPENLRHLIGASFETGTPPPELASFSLAEEAGEVLSTRRPKNVRLETPDGAVEMLVERLAPPLRLVIFGGGHDVPPLVALAKEVGYHVTVVDRRADFAEAARFPGADAVLHARPHLVRELALFDERTAVVTMNHHYETDAEIIHQLLASPLPYLGVLGPRKRTVKMLRECRERGATVNATELEKIHAPVGLDLGSETPEQIALCILAEVQAVMGGRTATQLRSRSALAEELLGPVAA
jgi:xanthine/CO dehydrogenase XdhC/CoxF family maturation factor